MAEKEEAKINLHELSQRELLIVVARDLKQLKTDFKELQKENHEMTLKITAQETRSKVWGGIAGFAAAITAAIAERLLNK
jgi:hypothetical protein